MSNLNLIKLNNKYNLQEDIIKDKKIILKEDRCSFSYKNTSQIIFMIGNKTCSHYSKDYLSLKLLESYLSFGMSSKLFNIFREYSGLAYEINVFFPVRKEISPFLIYLSSSEKNSIAAFKSLLSLWKAFTSRPIKEDDLKLAKVKLINYILSSYEKTEEIINREVQLLGYGITPLYDKKIVRDIKNIDSTQILKVITKYLIDPYLSVLGSEELCKGIRDIWINN